jgi:hypothetical protein
MGKGKFLVLSRHELRPLCRPARSQWLYRPRYRRSLITTEDVNNIGKEVNGLIIFFITGPHNYGLLTRCATSSVFYIRVRLILPAALCPWGVYSAFSRNEY